MVNLEIVIPKQAMKSNNTINTYRDGLTVFRKYLSEEKKVSIRKFKFEECTHDFLLEYMRYLKDKGCAAGTCNNRLAAIRAYLWYVADGEISMQSIALGASKVPFIKGTQKVKETINPDDLAALLAAPSDSSKIGIRDKTILILLYDSAIRVSELRALTLESLKLSETIPYIIVHGNGQLYIGLLENDEVYGPEPYGEITVNLGYQCPFYCSYIDTNNFPNAEEFIVSNGLGFFTGLTEQSGFCEYPLYQFISERLRELEPRELAQYERTNKIPITLQKSPERIQEHNQKMQEEHQHEHELEQNKKR